MWQPLWIMNALDVLVQLCLPRWLSVAQCSHLTLSQLQDNEFAVKTFSCFFQESSRLSSSPEASHLERQSADSKTELDVSQTHPHSAGETTRVHQLGEPSWVSPERNVLGQLRVFRFSVKNSFSFRCCSRPVRSIDSGRFVFSQIFSTGGWRKLIQTIHSL